MKSEKGRRRLITLVALLVAAGALGYLAFGGVGENLVYYWSPSELYEAGAKAEGATIRLGGLVAPGSVVRGTDGLTLRFEVTDGTNSVPVTAKAVPPAMFREGIGVVVEGTLLDGGTFETQRLMVKHDNEYQAPGTEDDRGMEELMETLQIEVPGT